MRLLLFDIDGTLVDSRGAGREGFRTALRAVYGETGPIDTFDFHGKTDPAIVRGLLREIGWEDAAIEDRMERLWPVYVRALERELAARDGRVGIYPGVVELLDRLRELEGFVPAILTGNVAPGAWRKLAAAGLADRFSFGAFGSDAERREELPEVALRRAREEAGYSFEPGEAVIIGDTPEDIRCARSAGLRAVAVATGRHGPDELAEHRPDHLFEDLAGTGRVVEALR